MKLIRLVFIVILWFGICEIVKCEEDNSGNFGNSVMSQTVGYYRAKIASNGGFTLISINLGNDSQSLRDIFGDQLVSNDEVIKADRIYKYNTKYSCFDIYARNGSGIYKEVGLNGFSNISNDVDFLDLGTNEVEDLFSTGDALFIKSPIGSLDRDIFIMGDVVLDTMITNSIVIGFQLMGYPFSCDIRINDMGIGKNGYSDGSLSNSDHIYVWNGTTYVIYVLWTNNLWYPSEIYGGVDGVATNVIGIGEGFWIDVRGNSRVWEERRGY